MNQIDKPRRGRPPKPVPPSVARAPRMIEVWDERFKSPTLVGRHENVPHDWLARDVLERFGIADHLAVYEIGASSRETIQHGKQKP